MISNTIKITITARSTEISIMRMVGASNWYIRIPFMLEGMLIGLFGAIIPILVLVYGYGALYNYTWFINVINACIKSPNAIY